MSTLDEITKEKQRLGECSRATATARRQKGLPPQRRRPRPRRRPMRRSHAGDVALRAQNQPAASSARRPSAIRFLALANGKTQQEIAAACKGARPNHVGVVIARHKRAGRIGESNMSRRARRSRRRSPKGR